jgi:hypothetical protein
MAERVGFGYTVRELSTSPDQSRYLACFQYRTLMFAETRIQNGRNARSNSGASSESSEKLRLLYPEISPRSSPTLRQLPTLLCGIHRSKNPSDSSMLALNSSRSPADKLSVSSASIRAASNADVVHGKASPHLRQKLGTFGV